MNNPGSLDSENELAEDQGRIVESQPRTIPWRIIVLGVIALVLAVIIATQVLGVLYVIVFPPGPPLPGDISLMSHTSQDYGVDDWLYDSRQSACNVLTFYVNSGGECRIAPAQCADDDETSGESDLSSFAVPALNQHVARCSGESKISIFAMRWQVIIATGPSPDVPTRFRITREIYWTGQVPPEQQLELP